MYMQTRCKLPNGEKFGQTETDKPLLFIAATGYVFSGIDEVAFSLQKGVSMNVEIAPEKTSDAEKEISTVPCSQLHVRCVCSHPV